MDSATESLVWFSSLLIHLAFVCWVSKERKLEAKKKKKIFCGRLAVFLFHYFPSFIIAAKKKVNLIYLK